MEGYFSRIRLPATAFRGDGYGLHQALWKLFADGPERKRDFLFQNRQHLEPGVCFVVSQRPPQPQDGWQVQTREYRPQLASGQSLVFSLRANPTVSRGRDGQRSARHDVVLDARRQAQARGETLTVAEAEQRAGREWLDRRAESNGFAIEQLRIAAYQSQQLRKRRQAAGIHFSTLDYEGVLRVTDPERLQHALFHGIGPAKAFGCGLLLARRA